jgi:hypothetical protein
MSYFLVSLLTVLNCIVLFFLSLFAVGGDGSADAIHRVWLFGYPWIVVFALIAYYECAKGRGSKAVGISASTLPAGYVAVLVGIFIGVAFDKIKPNTPEFEAACKSTGTYYLEKPTVEVRSIAYDWDPSTYPPRINHFKLDARGNARDLRYVFPQFSFPVRFIERRCCQYGDPYVRHLSPGESYRIPELSADVLVTYSVSHVNVAGAGSRLETVEIIVKDRRDEKILAKLRYVLDERQRRGCGVLPNGVMDEQAFIQRAIAIN